jgi:hypothetical protein
MPFVIDRSRLAVACLGFACVGFGPCSDGWGTWAGYDPAPCSGHQPQLLTELSPSAPVAYAELRALPGSSDDVLAQSYGDICAGASDSSACEEEIAAISPKSGIPLGDCTVSCPEYVLIHNIGEDTGIVSSRVDLVSYLAPIDTAGEAMLIVSSEGYDIACSDTNKAGVILEHDTGTGIGVIATRYKTSCYPAEEWQYDLVVAPDGSISVVQSMLWQSQDICLD